MANRKITARASLTSPEVSPANDLLGIVDLSAGVSGSKKITVDALFTGWGMTAAGAALSKAASLEAQRAALKIDDIYYDKAIIDFTGGGPTKLDGIATVGLSLGRAQLLNVNNTFYFYILSSGPVVEAAPYLIIPDDYNIITNNKIWGLAGLKTGSIIAGTGTFYDLINIGSNPAGTFSIYGNAATEDRSLDFPNVNGILTVRTQVTYLIPVTGATIVVPRYVDSYIYLNPATNLAALTFTFPDIADSIDGQTITIKCTKNVTLVNINDEGTDPTGEDLDDIVANEVYAFIYISAISNWDRIK